jgi:hypothetical protein
MSAHAATSLLPVLQIRHCETLHARIVRWRARTHTSVQALVRIRSGSRAPGIAELQYGRASVESAHLAWERNLLDAAVDANNALTDTSTEEADG